jgi:hypothetical protein
VHLQSRRQVQQLGEEPSSSRDHQVTITNSIAVWAGAMAYMVFSATWVLVVFSLPLVQAAL